MTSTARVITASNRAAAGVYEDRTGPIIVDWLRVRGYDVPAPVVVPDGAPVAAALREAVASGVHVVITTGGTGITPTDRTPEATSSVLDYEIPGLADAVRAAGQPEVPTAALSRGLAGVAGKTLVINLPGSTGGVRDGLGVLEGVLDHAVDQLSGGDHERQQGQIVPARVIRAVVTDEPLSVEEHAEVVADRAAGAVVTFGGVVRDHDRNKSVRELSYSGHPSAAEVIERVAGEIAGSRPGLRGIAVSHRIGDLQIGDVALACAVSAEHRAEAFAACSDLVDEVKHVYKRQGQLPVTPDVSAAIS